MMLNVRCALLAFCLPREFFLFVFTTLYFFTCCIFFPFKTVNPTNRGFVKLKTGEIHFYDYLVVATGSTTVAPFPIEGNDNCIVNPYQSESITQAYERLQTAKRIVVIGSGPVGVEVAGEVAARYPDREIILISQRTLLERLAPAAHKNVYQTLSKYKNLQIKLGKRVASITNNVVKVQNVADVDENTEWNGDEYVSHCKIHNVFNSLLYYYAIQSVLYRC